MYGNKKVRKYAIVTLAYLDKNLSQNLLYSGKDTGITASYFRNTHETILKIYIPYTKTNTPK